jgi:hypothetical protein
MSSVITHRIVLLISLNPCYNMSSAPYSFVFLFRCYSNSPINTMSHRHYSGGSFVYVLINSVYSGILETEAEEIAQTSLAASCRTRINEALN